MEILCLDFLVKTDQALAGAKGRTTGLLADLQSTGIPWKLTWEIVQ